METVGRLHEKPSHEHRVPSKERLQLAVSGSCDGSEGV